MRGRTIIPGGDAPFDQEDSYGWGMLIGFSGDGEERADADAYGLPDDWDADPLERP
ncbi:MAG TPA: hypothetical protein PK438_06690 [Clostridia bacterium]|jgi:hypothetical protein|nr:MAG: hypothetical protein BWY35_00045 [Firmicutes bacterium ADurb.Bin248]HOF99807.1 hypothetical protein [Clostridia bacterium]HOS18957.1 hypothetical protein [Clostridia bacterium]HPK14367.1 hypothetical protein [Clostridia bacterium]